LGKNLSGQENTVVEEVYQAVFGAEGAEELSVVQVGEPRFALERLHAVYEAGQRGEALPVVLYSEENLPADASMQQAMLGFDCCTPVAGALTSPFGYREHPIAGEEAFHYGVDLAAEKGTKIVSFGDGTVSVVGESSSYGNYCTVNHGGGCTTLYAHCDKILVSSGTAVRKGESIATVGNSGMATGSHLHFELQCEGTYLNPIYYIDCETTV
jgi:murein DD-endopeptidase MepM/ murein hydrolase activator NlpD